MKVPLKVAIVGCGLAAERIYLPALARIPDIRLVAVCDPIVERRDLLASRMDECRAYDSIESLFGTTSVEAVVVTTPPERHVDLAVAALGRDSFVLVEKPLALTTSDASRLLLLAPECRQKIMVGFNRRHWLPVRSLRKAIFNRRPDQTVSARLNLVSDVTRWSPVGGAADVLDDLATHQLDLLRYVLNREIVAIAARKTAEHAVHLRVRLACGSVAECEAVQGNRSQEDISVHCGGRSYRIQQGSEHIRPATGPVRRVADLASAFRRRVLGRQSSLRRSYELQLIEFFRAIRASEAVEPTVEDGMAALRAIEAARRSMLASVEVPVEIPTGPKQAGSGLDDVH